MLRTLPLGVVVCLLLFGCATYGNGMTAQEVADDYYSCIVIEASRDNRTMTEESLRSLHAMGPCRRPMLLYAKVLVTERGIPERFVDFNASVYMATELENQTITMMRESGLIK